MDWKVKELSSFLKRRCIRLSAGLIAWLVLLGVWHFCVERSDTSSWSRGNWLIAATLIGLPLLAIFIIAGWSAYFDVRNFRGITSDLRSINAIYRDVLASLFSVSSPSSFTPELLLRVEREALIGVTGLISSIFREQIRRRCTVTVKLVTNDECFTWARSNLDPNRDKVAVMYPIEKNSAFLEASKKSDNSYYHSADLESDKNYKNTRLEWKDYYKSTIVVPIRHISNVKDGNYHLIGFLTVDTMSRNRLNSTWHVELLRSFADQMYNFLSLMRRNYDLSSPVE